MSTSTRPWSSPGSRGLFFPPPRRGEDAMARLVRWSAAAGYWATSWAGPVGPAGLPG